jgi:hypothetical protein
MPILFCKRKKDAVRPTIELPGDSFDTYDVAAAEEFENKAPYIYLQFLHFSGGSARKKSGSMIGRLVWMRSDRSYVRGASDK